MKKIKRIRIKCKCGCGKTLVNRGIDGKLRFYIPSHWKKIFKQGLNKGKKWKDITHHNKWRGGRSTANGYIVIYSPNHPFKHKNRNYVYEHRLVMEKKIGRYLTPKELVHHINGNRLDNRLENLGLTDRSSHGRHHGKEHYNNGMTLFGKVTKKQ